MERQYEHKGHKYWVKVESAIHEITHEEGFIAYVNDQKPGGLLYGKAVRDENGNIMFFKTTLAALTNANAIKQNELDHNI